MLNVSLVNFLCVVVNLLVLLLLMKKFLYQPVLAVIAKRQELLEGQFAEAEAAKEEAMQLRKQYEDSLANAKHEQEQAIKEAKIQAGIEYDKILEEAEEKKKQMLEEAEKAGRAEQERAIKATEQEIAKLAAAAASRIVMQMSDAKNDAVIYDEFLKKAGEKSGTNRN